MHELTLFYRPTCPYCQKVLAFVNANDIPLALKDISKDPEAQRELMTVGGKTQVPCLRIDGKAMYESDDIIRWMGDHL